MAPRIVLLTALASVVVPARTTQAGSAEIRNAAGAGACSSGHKENQRVPRGGQMAGCLPKDGRMSGVPFENVSHGYLRTSKYGTQAFGLWVY